MDNIYFHRKCKAEVQQRFVLNAIQVANPDVLFISHKEMCECVIEEWQNSTTATFAEWLKNQDCIAIPNDRDTIEVIGKAWGYCKTKNSTERFVATWYERIANKFIQMCNKLNLEL